MKLTKLTAALCAVLLSLGLMSGCGGNSSGSQPAESASAPALQSESVSAEAEAPKTQVRVGTMKGPTGMGMVGVMNINDQGTSANDYTFTIAGAVEEMTAKLISGELDIAAIPSNMASVLYNKTKDGVSMIAVNTLGVLYVLDTTEQVTAVSDLKGKTLYATGQGAAPEYVLQYLLQKNGIDPETDIEIVYKAEHAELATMMASDTVDLALLPQPFVTTVTSQNDKVKVALDITAEWAKISSDSTLAMGCLVVRNEFLQENKAAVDAFLLEYEESVNFVNRDITDAAELMAKYDIIPQAVAEKAIPACNIVYIGGEDMQSYVAGYLKVLQDANPQAVGGSLPDDEFYYKG